MVFVKSLWISGPSRSGKTTILMQQFADWVQQGRENGETGKEVFPRSVLVLAPTGDRRVQLADQISKQNQDRYPIDATTPLGFFQNQTILFWPLLIKRLKLKPQFPVSLRPETEQELATRLWRPELDRGQFRWAGVSEYRLVRRTLDLMQLAAVSGTPIEEIPLMLEQGAIAEGSPELWACMGELLLRWRQWCLDRGLLTYGIVAELYWRYLLDDCDYQKHLVSRYQGVLGDDVDEYPSVARDLFEVLLDRGIKGAFTYNIDGQVRLGLGADSNYLARLADRPDLDEIRLDPLHQSKISANSPLKKGGKGGSVQPISQPTASNSLRPYLTNWISTVTNPDNYQGYLDPEEVREKIFSIQTVSRAELLQETAEAIAHGIETSAIAPQDIALIAPGLDEIARYTLIQTLASLGVPVNSLNDQRRLINSPTIRGLLTLLAVVYPGLGRLVDRDAIAELLVIFSFKSVMPSSMINSPNHQTSTQTQPSKAIPQPPWPIEYRIDPVRAGLLADYCYAPDPISPQLLPVTSFSRWDRLGYRATKTYQEIVDWIEEMRSQLQQGQIPSPMHLLDRGIQQFFSPVHHLSKDQVSALRELMEAAGHYWQVDRRLRVQGETGNAPDHVTVGQFIQLLRQGTVTANPFPVSAIALESRGVTLANIFQYRSAKLSHRWHFWLDAGSPLWLSGGAATLFGSQLFLRQWSGRSCTVTDQEEAAQERLQRILNDLLSRVGDRLYLCHSQLSTSGQDQIGPLLSWIDAVMGV